MKERPIIFSGPMIPPILAGTKTQTRRIVKPRADRDFGSRCVLQPHEIAGEINAGDLRNSVYGFPGDRLWLRPWPPFRRLSRYIDIEFDREVGERSGSWKGGVLGCSYEMRRNETPVDALRRMERERVFS